MFVLKSVSDCLWFFDATPVGSQRFFDVLGLSYIYDYWLYTRRGLSLPPHRPRLRHFESIFFRICLPTMIVSIAVVHGAVITAHLYSGGERRDVIGTSYVEAFNLFFSLQFTLPDISFDMSLHHKLPHHIAAIINFQTSDPTMLLEGANALSALNLIISLVRPMVTRLHVLLAYCAGGLNLRTKDRANKPSVLLACCSKRCPTSLLRARRRRASRRLTWQRRSRSSI
jgi:hypothetical protein